MYCHACGQPNPDNATSCQACGATFGNPYQTPAAHTPGALPYGNAPYINNYLVPAILSTLCCCLPFGIVSIVYAAQVNGRLAGGDVPGAMQCASNAKMWFWIAFACGLVPQLLYFAFVIFAALTGMLDEPR